MPLSVVRSARWQFDLTWSLLSLHLEPLTDDDCLWEPAAGAWTVRRGPDGAWHADFAETEPDPPPTTTIGWLTWQVIWWWSAAVAAARGETPPGPHEVAWPGDAAGVTERLRELRTTWIDVLEGLSAEDLWAVAAFPWQDGEHTVEHMIAWANAELMKNTAEIGQLRILRANLEPS